MAEGRGAARGARRLQARLARAREPAELSNDYGSDQHNLLKLKNLTSLFDLNSQEIIKALKGLQDLDITLDILQETGLGKTVNSFRKHATAGKVAKSLINQWKKLIPPGSESGHRSKKQNTEKEKHETKSSISKENKPSEEPKTSVLASKSSSVSEKLNKDHSCLEKKHRSRDSESHKACDSKEGSSSGSKCAAHGANPKAKNSSSKERTSADSNKLSEKQDSVVGASKDLSHPKEKTNKGASKQKNPEHVEKPKQKLFMRNKAELSSDDEFEPPTMSFESYLNYDQVTNKRKRKASSSKQPKKPSEQKSSSLTQNTSKGPGAKAGEVGQRSEDDQSETPSKKAKVASLQDLLNTPLPKFLPGISVSSPSYAAEFKAPVAEPPQQVSETVQFTGRRLNSKMQVYSGSKTVCLSKMLTLYEQCIRVLQNNIDSLHEVGGVPFEILEPVLTRCTPEQLFRIEENNPAFTEESDHLWKKHCQRDFKNESLLEYESWREMYLRLFSQREEKLKMLTKNILSAQSEKPKGRQVKMAYINSVAKPPRSVRRRQEIHGTAGPVVQLHPLEKYNLLQGGSAVRGSKAESEVYPTVPTDIQNLCPRGWSPQTRIPEIRDRNSTSSNPSSNTNGGYSSSSGVTQDGKKTIKRIAPIMRKTLKALKNRAGRR